MNAGRSTARFIEPMECLPVTKLPEGAGWTWEIKLDGWRMEAVKTGGKLTLYSRRAKGFNEQFGSIASALQDLADKTVIDGEIVAVDEESWQKGRTATARTAHWSVAQTAVQSQPGVRSRRVRA
jgi:ATP-dependent DNA ligase